jgi:hypothetical protein
MKLIKAIWETLIWFIKPYCDHEAGICIKGQGRSCRIKKGDVIIERYNTGDDNE